MKKLLLLLPLVLIAGVLAALYFVSAAPEISFGQPVTAVTSNTAIVINVDSPHGLRALSLSLSQGGKVYEQPIVEQQPSRRFLFWRERRPPTTITARIDPQGAKQFRSGNAELVVRAQANDFRAATARIDANVRINQAPPKLQVDNLQHYINQGGSELVTFTVSGYWTQAGVRVGQNEFRSFPMPGHEHPAPDGTQQRFSLFAFPWNVAATEVPVVFARNDAGGEVTAPFWVKVFPKRFRHRRIELTDSFMQKVVAELHPPEAPTLLHRFLVINREFRKRDNEMLSSFGDKTASAMLWSEPFLQLANSKVEAVFADDRTYVYEGKDVDEEVHLGFDLSKVRNTPVEAANDGKVVYGGPLGIYGNCIVLDHGYGLQSIYAHLNRIDVKAGDSVKRGATMGLTDSTGLAGGDHLHFGMQVDGVQVNPLEWWDKHWIQDHIWNKLPPPESPAP